MNPVAFVDPKWLVLGLIITVALLAEFGLVWIIVRRDREGDAQLLRQLFHSSEEHFDSGNRRLRQIVEHCAESVDELRRTVGRVGLRGLSRWESERIETSPLDRKHHVVSLAQQGLEPHDIARRLNMPRGETDLVLGLSKNFSSWQLPRYKQPGS
ncbi:MAG: hypothetical protein ACE5JX_03335 [Acidobacteriota bacterium]